MQIIFLLIEKIPGRTNKKMNALETILKRKSIPLMSDPKPSSKELKQIYKAGLRAPDHCSLKPWKFIEISGEDRKKLSNIFVKVTKKTKKNPSKLLLKKMKNAPFRAPLIIVIVANIIKNNKVPKIEQILSAGAAAQNIMLAAFSFGYYSIWRTGHLAFNKHINKEFKLKKSDEVIGFLYIGSSDKKIPKIKPLQLNKYVKKLG